MAHRVQKDLLSELKEARVSSGLTQKELAIKTGIPRTTISKIEAGFRNTTVKTMLDMAKAVNLDLRLVKQNLLKSARALEAEFDVLNLITIDETQILKNYDFFVKNNPSKSVWPVLKSNAYGHGITQIASILSKREIPYLVVDSYFEALQIWQENPKQHVLLIGTVLPQNFPKLELDKVAFTIYDLHSLRALGELGTDCRIHLKINTGFNRQGVKEEEIENFCKMLKTYPQIELEGVLSHLADADNPSPNFTISQINKFNQALEIISEQGFAPKYIHLGATSGSTIKADKKSNAVRLGIGLYGFNPLPKNHPEHQDLREINSGLTFSSTITNVVEIDKGDKVSYNGTFVADKPMRIGVLPLGYFEVYDRKLSNKGFARYKNHDLPILGRICMNITIVDLTNTDAKLFDRVEIINPDQNQKNSVTHMAKLSDTIVYETLVKINAITRRKVV